MPEFDPQEFHRAYYLLALYAHQLIRQEEYMPESTWNSQIKDEAFADTVVDLTENGYAVRGEYENGPGYSITPAGQALLWLYSDVLKSIWTQNMDGEGEQLINFLVANLDAYAAAMRERQAEREAEAAEANEEEAEE